MLPNWYKGPVVPRSGPESDILIIDIGALDDLIGFACLFLLYYTLSIANMIINIFLFSELNRLHTE